MLHIIALVIVNDLVIWVLVVLDLRLLLEYYIGRSLEKVGPHEFFVLYTDIHAALVLYDLFF